MMKRTVCICCALLLCLCVLQGTCAAAVDPARDCSLTLTYAQNGTAYADLNIEIYRVAALGEDGAYHLVEPYSGYPVSITGITSQTQWQEVAQTLNSYITSHQVKADASRKTDDKGQAVFTELEVGLYLVRGVSAQTKDGKVSFRDFMVYLPTPVDGVDDYDVEAKPKGTDEPDPEQYTVRKLWQDTGSTAQRPDTVCVEILKDGKVYQSVLLSSANNWTYTWQVTEPGSVWTVVEKDVPSGYKVTVTKNTTTFVITNTKTTTPGNPGNPGGTTPGGSTPKPNTPYTGDEMPVTVYVLLLCAAGFVLIVVGILKLRDTKHEKKR